MRVCRENARERRPLLLAARELGRIGSAELLEVEPMQSLLVLLFSIRLVARNRALARERDAKAQLLAELQRVADFRRDFIANVRKPLS